MMNDASCPNPISDQLPGAKQHFRALVSTLRHVRAAIEYTQHALRRWNDDEWPLAADSVSRELAVAAAFLAGALDGAALLESSVAEGSGHRSVPPDFWTLAHFWRLWPPHGLHPQWFGGSRDVAASAASAAPVVGGLLVPTFNAACGAMRGIADGLQEGFPVRDLAV